MQSNRSELAMQARWQSLQENCKVLGHGGTVILSEAKDLVGVLGLA